MLMTILFYRIQYPKLCIDVPVTSEKEESKEWLKERCKHDKFFSKNEKLCANSDTIKKEDDEKNDSESAYADAFELTTTPFTTPTTTDFQEEVEVTTETESLTT